MRLRHQSSFEAFSCWKQTPTALRRCCARPTRCACPLVSVSGSQQLSGSSTGESASLEDFVSFNVACLEDGLLGEGRPAVGAAADHHGDRKAQRKHNRQHKQKPKSQHREDGGVRRRAYSLHSEDGGDDQQEQLDGQHAGEHPAVPDWLAENGFATATREMLAGYSWQDLSLLSKQDCMDLVGKAWVSSSSPLSHRG